MADKFAVYIDEKDLKDCAVWLEKFGKNLEPAISNAMDWATNEIANHAKASHFFVGIGKGSSKVAEENTFTFVNPDGTPRFKIRTGNLRNSIQPMRSYKIGETLFGQVNAGMKYAQWIEEGSAKMKRKGGFPFMRPALEAVKQPFIKRLITNIKSFVRSKGGKDS